MVHRNRLPGGPFAKIARTTSSESVVATHPWTERNEGPTTPKWPSIMEAMQIPTEPVTESVPAHWQPRLLLVEATALWSTHMALRVQMG